MRLPFAVSKRDREHIQQLLGIADLESDADSILNDHAYAKVAQFAKRRACLRMLTSGVNEIGARVTLPEHEKGHISHRCVGKFNCRDVCRIYSDLASANISKFDSYPVVAGESSIRVASATFCVGDALNCPVVSDELFFDNSVYDMTPEQVCLLMFRKKSRRALATLCFDHRFLIDDVGSNACFTWRHRSDKVLMTMGGGGTETYIHDSKTVKRWMCGGWTQEEGFCIMWRLIDTVGYMAVMEITPIFCGKINITCNVFTNDSYIRVFGPHVKRITGRDFFYVEKEFFDSLVAKASVGANLSDIVKFARTKRNLLVINNTIVSTETKADSYEMVMLCVLALRKSNFCQDVLRDVDIAYISGSRMWRRMFPSSIRNFVARNSLLPKRYIFEDLERLISDYTIDYDIDEVTSYSSVYVYNHAVFKHTISDSVISMYSCDRPDSRECIMNDYDYVADDYIIRGDVLNDTVIHQFPADVYNSIGNKRSIISSLAYYECTCVFYIDAILLLKYMRDDGISVSEASIITRDSGGFRKGLEVGDVYVNYECSFYNVADLSKNTRDLHSVLPYNSASEYRFWFVHEDLSNLPDEEIAYLYTCLLSSSGFCFKVNSRYANIDRLYNVSRFFKRINFYTLPTSTDSSEFFLVCTDNVGYSASSLKLLSSFRHFRMFGNTKSIVYDYQGGIIDMSKARQSVCEVGVDGSIISYPESRCDCCISDTCILLSLSRSIVRPFDENTKCPAHGADPINFESCYVGMMSSPAPSYLSAEFDIKQMALSLGRAKARGDIMRSFVLALYDAPAAPYNMYQSGFHLSSSMGWSPYTFGPDDDSSVVSDGKSSDTTECDDFENGDDGNLVSVSIDGDIMDFTIAESSCLGNAHSISVLSDSDIPIDAISDERVVVIDERPDVSDTSLGEAKYDIIDGSFVGGTGVCDVIPDDVGSSVSVGCSDSVTSEICEEVPSCDVVNTGSVGDVVNSMIGTYDFEVAPAAPPLSPSREYNTIIDELVVIPSEIPCDVFSKQDNISKGNLDKNTVNVSTKVYKDFDKPIPINHPNNRMATATTLIKRSIEYFEAEERAIKASTNHILTTKGEEMGLDNYKFSMVKVQSDGSVNMNCGIYAVYSYVTERIHSCSVSEVCNTVTNQTTREISLSDVDKERYDNFKVFFPGAKFAFHRLGADILPSLYEAVKSGVQCNDRILYAGVPGEGKTHKIVASLIGVTKTKSILVLAKSNSAVAEILDRIRNHNKTLREHRQSNIGTGYIEEANLTVMTFSRALSTSPEKRKRYYSLIMDEVSQAMAGEIEAVIKLYRVKKVFAYGDPQQCAFVSNATTSSPLDSFMNSFKNMTWNYVTRRCPINVTDKLSYFYDGHKITTTSDNQGTITIMGLDRSIDVSKFDLIMVASNSEEGWVKGALTVAKAQGKSVKRTLVIDTSSSHVNVLWNTPSIVLVALTRHTEHITVMTAGRESMLLKFARHIMGNTSIETENPISLSDNLDSRGCIYPLERFAVDRYLSADAEEYVRMKRKNLINKTMSDRAQVQMQNMRKTIMSLVLKNLDFEDTDKFTGLVTMKDRENISDLVASVNIDLSQLADVTIESLNEVPDAMMEADGSAMMDQISSQNCTLNVSGECKFDLDEDVVVEEVKQINDDFISYLSRFQPCISTTLASASKRIFAIGVKTDGNIALADELANKWIRVMMKKDCGVWSGAIEKSDAEISLCKLGKSEMTVVHEGIISKGVSIAQEDFSVLRFARKDKLKAKVDGSGTKELGATQLIEFQDKHTNFIATTKARAFKRWMDCNFREGVAISPAWTDEEFEVFFSHHQSNFNEELNLDFSKFDRSVKVTLLMSFLLVLVKLGFDQDIVKMQWSYFHTKTVTDGRMSFRIFAQVMSGLWCTLFGNSMINSMAYVSANMFTVADVGVFTGDDGRVLTNYRNDRMSGIAHINEVLGMEVKDVDYGVGYFCGRVILTTGDGMCKVFGDLGRLTEKLIASKGIYDDAEMVLSIKTAVYRLKHNSEFVQAYVDALKRIYKRDYTHVVNYILDN